MLQAFKMKGKIVNTRSQLNLRLQKVTLNSLNKSLPDINWRDMFSEGQFKSKEWLVEYLIRSTGTINDVVICGGWCGLLAQLLYLTKLNINSITSLDLEEKHTSAANSIIRNKSFKAITCDMHDFDYTKVDTVINTSCEHVENFSDWYSKVPAGRLMVLQSNNYFEHDEHVNCVASLEEFKKQCAMDTIMYSGELDLPLYKRFMIIGYK